MASKMKKCSRVKNPCKICLQTVTNKNGIQCQGACKKWAHFTCLNYTPGKIKDIKAGIITITCPCPNCKTQEPKEFLSNPPYTCDYQQCPANKVPQCEINECPLNNPNVVMSRGVSPQPTQMGTMPCGPTCATSKTSYHTPPASSPEMMKAPPSYSHQPKQPEPQRLRSQAAMPPMAPCEMIPPACMSHPIMPTATPPRSARHSPRGPSTPPRSARHSPRGPSTPTKTSRTPSKREIKAEKRAASPHLKSRSCSCLSGRIGHLVPRDMVNASSQGNAEYDDAVPVIIRSGDCKLSCSDSRLSSNKDNQKILMCTIQELCSTVGHLSHQIKDLMCRMMNDEEK